MSDIHIQRIEAALRANYGSLIDTTGWAIISAEQRDKRLLSQALAAYALSLQASVNPDVAAASLVACHS